MINIFRSLNGDGLTAQVAIGRTKAYIDLTEDEKIDYDAIGHAAQAMGGEFSKAVSDYKLKRASMEGLSQELHKRILTCAWPRTDEVSKGGVFNFVALGAFLDEGKPLTHSEIYWLDWFLRKHKLTGGSNGR